MYRDIGSFDYTLYQIQRHTLKSIVAWYHIIAAAYNIYTAAQIKQNWVPVVIHVAPEIKCA
jgi:putative effector of murein hydrolase